ncbi:hypothetical protein PMZ80_006228 [Knufia obscura]|uniref:CASTOR ACT domain-containing protein n=1 Tax=Knufia obscura TaxID=1635080 RepID=A0ABR0RK08_9EURO|nr:hypothetical protein PMZ80_006228 [Knufia obscura]
MTDSMNLINAQVTFLEPRLVLVHIPNELFSFFTQPFLRILFDHDHSEDTSKITWTDRHAFLNLSITPVGCSLICSKELVEKYLTPLTEQFDNLLGKTKAKSAGIETSHDEYVAIQVDGQGLDAGQRVLELTGPLAMAGISIFFITTYFSDYILVPVKARHTVVTTLQQRGFVFSAEAEAYVSQLSPILQHNRNLSSPFHERPQTASSSGSDGRPPSSPMPSTPPAKDIPELQIRTFTKLMKNKIEPAVDPNLRLVNCAGNRDHDEASTRQLKEDLIQVLLASNSPRPTTHKTVGLTDDTDFSAKFLSMTLSSEPISILMEERLLTQLGSTLLGTKGEEDVLVPIVLDLRALGWTATGIVGGVAGRLSQGAASFQLEEGDNEPVEISFLSSAKAGSVIVRAKQLGRALRALELGMEEVKGRK